MSNLYCQVCNYTAKYPYKYKQHCKTGKHLFNIGEKATAIYYKIVHKDNKNLIYIGSTFNLKSRKSQHLNAFKKNKYPELLIYRAFEIYGIGNFIMKKICEKQVGSIREKEAYEQLLIYSIKAPLNKLLKTPTGDWKCSICYYTKPSSFQYLTKIAYHNHWCRDHPNEYKIKQKFKDILLYEVPTILELRKEKAKAVKQRYANSEKGKLAQKRKNDKAKIKCEHDVRPNACKICNPFHCEICNITTSKSAKSRHLKSKSHIYKSNPELKPKRKPDKRRDCIHNKIKEQCKECSPKICEICHKVYSKSTYRRHIKSQHK